MVNTCRSQDSNSSWSYGSSIVRQCRSGLSRLTSLSGFLAHVISMSGERSEAPYSRELMSVAAGESNVGFD